MKNPLLLTITVSISLLYWGPANSQSGQDDSKLSLTPAKRVERLTQGKPALMTPLDRADRLPGNLGDSIVLFHPSTVMVHADGSAWRPMRNFGPFSNGPEFSAIRIFIRDPSSVDWIWNDYFAGHVDAAIYRKYFAGAFPPASNALNVTHYPGAVPPITQANPIGYENMLFQLGAVSWSSQYGGSVCLEFSLSEDVQFEIRNAGTLWDLTGCLLRIYINARRESMNPITDGNLLISGAKMKEFFNAELIPNDEVVQYAVVGSANQTRIEKAADVDKALLNETLSEVAGKIREKIAEPAFRFAHGFLHCQFQDRLKAGDAVDSIELTDNYADLVTHQREAVMAVFSRSILPHSRTDWFVWTDSGLVVRTDSSHVWSNGYMTPGRSYTVDLGDDFGGWKIHGAWKVRDECDRIVAVDFDISASERDALSADDRFEPFSDWWQMPSCSELNAQVPNTPTPPRVLDEYGVVHDLILNGEKAGWIYMQYRLLLHWR